MRCSLFACWALIALVCAGCYVRASPSTPPTVASGTLAAPAAPTGPPGMLPSGLMPAEVSTAPQEIPGVSRFGLELYAQLRANDSGNLFYSPWNISTALAMTYAGAKGDTAAQMAKVLHFGPESPAFHEAMAQRLAALAANKPGHELHVANRLWGAKGEPFRAEFLATNRDRYGAELALVDFAQNAAEACQQINAWSSEHTREKIRELVSDSDVDASTRLVLTSAIYFKSQWLSKFDPQQTRPEKFHTGPDAKVDVPMMHQQGPFLMTHHDGMRMIELPYVGGAQSMLVLLPDQVDGLKQLEERLTAGQLAQWTSQLQAQEVELSLPKFTFSSSFQLADTLVSMGLTAPFDPAAADFSGMSSDPGLYLAKVIHKAFVAVEEEGTEAAAATAVIAMRGPSQPAVFKADHPFVFVIRDNATHELLFVGRVVQP